MFKNQLFKTVLFRTVRNFALVLVGLVSLSACIPQIAAINGDNSRFAVGQYTGNWEMTYPNTEQFTATLTINQARNGSLFGVLTDSVNNRTPIQLICNPLVSTQFTCFSSSQNAQASLTITGNIGENGYSGLWQAIDIQGEKNGLYNFSRVSR